MESQNTTQTPNRQLKNDLVLVRDTNEWGQITDLEKNATYFVIRKPTKELTQQKSKEFVSDVRAFLHEHRVLTEKQFEEINTRYGEPAKARAKELRETMEKKFDEISKEFEARVEELERRFVPKKDAANGETPGEMPRGDAPETSAASSTKTTKKPKSGQ